MELVCTYRSWSISSSIAWRRRAWMLACVMLNPRVALNNFRSVDEIIGIGELSEATALNGESMIFSRCWSFSLNRKDRSAGWLGSFPEVNLRDRSKRKTGSEGGDGSRKRRRISVTNVNE
jgi:hypothetical protein